MTMAASAALPPRFNSVEELEEFMTAPSAQLCRDLASIDGDLMVLGVGGKMGPTLARLARRAAPAKRIIGVARFSEPRVRQRLEDVGVECVTCDMLQREAVEQLPRVENIVYMAGQKFGTSGNPALTWAINVGVPFIIADTFREARIVAFSTACVYPYMDVSGSGAKESTPTLPPPGDYANSCVGREQMFLYGSHRYGTPGRVVRLSYAIDLRYGVLHDVATSVRDGKAIDVTTGCVNVIWQGDANEQALQLLAHCTTPTTPLNITGPEKISVRRLAEKFGKHFDRKPQIVGQEAGTAWLVDTTAVQHLLGPPRVPLETMIDWVAEWVAHDRPSLGRKTHFEVRDGNY
jgi:nucleoside-diphosphate-sugar epimerase